MATTKCTCCDPFPTASEAAVEVKKDYACDLIKQIKLQIEKAIKDKHYQVLINEPLHDSFNMMEEPVLKEAVLKFFNKKEYEVTEWRIATYRNIAGYMCYGTNAVLCRISWIPK